jgi:hypothetical protein
VGMGSINHWLVWSPSLPPPLPLPVNVDLSSFLPLPVAVAFSRTHPLRELGLEEQDRGHDIGRRHVPTVRKPETTTTTA